MEHPKTVERIAAELAEITAQLEQRTPEVTKLKDRQRALWAVGRELGMDSRSLAEVSGVESVTVRLYWNPAKVSERAKDRPAKRKAAAALKKG